MKFVLVKFDSVLFNFVGERSTLKNTPLYHFLPTDLEGPQRGTVTAIW